MLQVTPSPLVLVENIYIILDSDVADDTFTIIMEE